MAFVVDGMNVIGARPDGWWRYRRSARLRLVSELESLAHDGTEVTVVFDGRPGAGEPPPGTGLAVTFAPGGPNVADDVIVATIEGLTRPEDTIVVTSDRGLAARVRLLGAVVESPSALRARLGTGRR